MKHYLFSLTIFVAALAGCSKKDSPKPTPDPPKAVLAITDFNPKSAMKGENVMITGTAFGTDADAVTVKFGSSDPIKPKSVSSTKITLDVPPSAKSGKIEVNVKGETVSSSSEFTLTEKPAPDVSVTGVSPLSATAGTVIEITGTAFGTDKNFVAVTIGSSKPVKPESVTPKTILVRIPDDATSGDVTVAVNGGTAVKAKEQFTLKVLPLGITDLSSNSGKVGAEIFINGSGFGTDVKAIAVYFGDSNPVTPKSVSGSRIVVNVPESGSSGKVKVVLNGNSTVTTADDFKIELSITSFSPKSGTADDIITIKGASFTDVNDISVYMDSESLSPIKAIKVTPHEIQVKVPLTAKSGKIRISGRTGLDVSAETFTFLAPAYFSDVYLPTQTRISSIIKLNVPLLTINDVKDINVSIGGSNPVNPVLIDNPNVYVRVPNDAKTGKITLSMKGYAPYTRSFVIQINPVERSGPWLRMTDFGGSGRTNSMVFTIGNKVYVCGGMGRFALGTDYFSDLWEYDTATQVWLKKADFKGGMRYGGVAFSIGNIGYVGTGFDQNGNPKNDLWAYDPKTNAWTQKANFQGESRGYAVGFEANNKGFIGSGMNSSKKSLDDFYRYDPSSNTWAQVASISGARSQSFVFVINDKAYVGNGNIASNLQMYDPIANSWVAKAALTSYTSIQSSAFSINGKGYAGLGDNGYVSNIPKKVFEYNPATNSWNALPEMGSVSIGGIGFAIGNIGYFGLGGGIDGVAPDNDIWTYNP